MPNPTLTPERIQPASEELEPGWALGTTAGSATTAPPTASSATMTAGGTFGKTFFLWLIVVAAATYSWGQTAIPVSGQIRLPGWTWPAVFVGFGLAMLRRDRPARRTSRHRIDHRSSEGSASRTRVDPR